MNSGPLTILHVEDDPDHANLVARSFRKHQVANEIRLVEDGEAALDYLFHRREHRDPQKSPSPHVILLDLRLPKVDGLEILRTIKTSKSLLRIPVIVLTSSDAERDVAQAYEYHANSYLVKPFDFAELSDMLKELGLYWLGWNRYPCPSMKC